MADPGVFEIDEGDLAGEWGRQPGVTYRAGEAVADAEHAVAQAKAALEVLEAELRRAVRADPARYGLDKVTEQALADVVACSKQRKAAVAEVNRLRHAVDVLKAKLGAVQDRRRALERMVELLQINYYGEPRESRTPPGAAATMSQAAARRPLRGKAT